jgi:hypothetical protein
MRHTTSLRSARSLFNLELSAVRSPSRAIDDARDYVREHETGPAKASGTIVVSTTGYETVLATVRDYVC